MVPLENEHYFSKDKTRSKVESLTSMASHMATNRKGNMGLSSRFAFEISPAGYISRA
jgi:hypothetical protein